MIIEDFTAFDGVHCETTTVGTMLSQLDLRLSEPMLFGLGEGLGFIYWNMKAMDFPFIGGRIKPDQLTANLCRNLGLILDAKETSSPPKAWQAVQALIDEGRVVGLKMDCFHLEYFGNPIHFAGHYAALYGYDEKNAHLIDTRPQGGRVKTSRESLARARSAKGPMSSRNLYFTISKGGKTTEIDRCLKKAIRGNATEYLNPPIANIGYRGIAKTATEIKKWFHNSKDIRRDFCTTAMLMERAGTGGALFRNLYRDFLGEANDLLGAGALAEARAAFVGIAADWTKVSGLLEQAGKTADFACIEGASELLAELSKREHAAMKVLAGRW